MGYVRDTQAREQAVLERKSEAPSRAPRPGRRTGGKPLQNTRGSTGFRARAPGDALPKLDGTDAGAWTESRPPNIRGTRPRAAARQRGPEKPGKRSPGGLRAALR